MKSAREIFSENLTKYMRRNGIDQKELANVLKVSQPTISSWINKKKYPRIDTIEKLSEYFKVDKSDLTSEKSLSNVVSVVPATQVPIVSSVSAGDPIFSEENIIDYAFLPSTVKKNGKEFFYLKVSGDSMDREFNSGDLVLVEKGGHIENGQIGVVALNGDEATVKRIKYDENNVYLIPESNNPTHMPRVYNDNDDIRFIGRVVGMTRTF